MNRSSATARGGALCVADACEALEACLPCLAYYHLPLLPVSVVKLCCAPLDAASAQRWAVGGASAVAGAPPKETPRGRPASRFNSEEEQRPARAAASRAGSAAGMNG